MGVDWQLCLRIDDIFAQAIAPLHQSIQVVAGRVHLYPSRMVLWSRRFSEAYCFQLAFLISLLVTPYSVCPHICAVEIGLGGVKDHTVDCCLFAVFEVLDVLLDMARGVDREDIPVTSIVVERIAIHVVRRFLAGKEEYGACLRVGVVGFGYEACQW